MSELTLLTEQKTLYSLINDSDARALGMDVLFAEDFQDSRNRSIFLAIAELDEDSNPVDFMSVADSLKRKGKNIEIKYLVDVNKSAATTTNIENDIKRLKEVTLKREMQDFFINLDRQFKADTIPPGEMLSEIQTWVETMASQQVSTEGFTKIGNQVFDYVEEIKLARKQKKRPGITTGYAALDTYLSGFQPGNVYILAGRVGEGKTAMACNIARRLAGKTAIPVAVSSLEMSSREIINRLLAIESGVDGHEIRDAIYLSDKDLNEVTRAAGKVANHLTWIDPTAGLDALSLRNRVKRWKASIDKPGLLIVDYLQLIAPSKKHGSREQEVAHTSRMLKSISMDLEIPVLALSQFSRKVDSRDDPEPKLSDLRESGAIEQDASVVLFLYRPDPNDDYLKNQYKLKIAKNRHGGRGEIGLTFRPHCLEFVETAGDAEPPGNYQDEKDRNELPF